MHRLTLHRAAFALAASLTAASLSACQADPAATDTAAVQPQQRWSTTTERGSYKVAVGPRDGRAPVGQFHDWVIEVRDAAGNAQPDVRLAIDGRMPDHGHGLPTRPQITQHLGDGRYLVEGVRFNMAGRWQLMVAVDGPAGQDRGVFDVDLAF